MQNAKNVRKAIDAQNRRLNSPDPHRRVFAAFWRCGDVAKHLPHLTDRQIGQLVFDHVWDSLGLVTPAMAICNEAIERLFRSPAGARPEDERFNDLCKAPTCPVCGDLMLHFFGVGEGDYDQCQSVECGHKVPRAEQHLDDCTTPLRVGVFERVINIIDKHIHVGKTKEHGQ